MSVIVPVTPWYRYQVTPGSYHYRVREECRLCEVSSKKKRAGFSLTRKRLLRRYLDSHPHRLFEGQCLWQLIYESVSDAYDGATLVSLHTLRVIVLETQVVGCQAFRRCLIMYCDIIRDHDAIADHRVFRRAARVGMCYYLMVRDRLELLAETR